MNKRGLSQIQRIGIGSLMGISGIIIISFGSVTNQVWITRGGIALVTFGIWLSTWN